MDHDLFLNLKWRGDKKQRSVIGSVLLVIFAVFLNSSSAFGLVANIELAMAVFASLLVLGCGIFALFEIKRTSWILWLWLSLILIFFVWIIYGFANGYF